MAKRVGGFIGQDGINAPDQVTGVTGTAGDEHVTVSWTAPSDVGGAAVTRYQVQSTPASVGVPTSYTFAAVSYDGVSFDVGDQDGNPNGLSFNDDGTKMYICGRNSDAAYQYSLSTAYDISTASYDSVSLGLSGQDTDPYDLKFNNDGTSMYIVGRANKTVFQYTLTTAYDLSTASYASKSFSFASQDDTPTSVAFNLDGTRMIATGYTNDKAYQYTLSTAFDVSTASYDDVSIGLVGSFQEDIVFNPDGTRMFITTYSAATDSENAVHQYNLSTAFDITTAVLTISVPLTQATQMRAIAFNGDGTKFILAATTGATLWQYSSDGVVTESPVTLTNLTNDTEYTFNVWAINPFGWSSSSDASEGVTPAVPVIGLFAGGYDAGNSYVNTIDRVVIGTPANATDFGDLTVARRFAAGCSSSTRGIFGAGFNGSNLNTIDYVTIASAGNATDFGNCTVTVQGRGACSSSTRGVFAGGGTSDTLTIDYVTIASTGNATFFGNLTQYRYLLAGCSSPTRGVFGGGTKDGVRRNFIDYITIASTGNATDFGDLTIATSNLGACSSSTRGLFIGGRDRGTTIDYITIASTGNATDFGDCAWFADGSAASSSTYGVFGGQTTEGGDASNQIQTVAIASLGNASDFGDLTVTRYGAAACSSGHGGLS